MLTIKITIITIKIWNKWMIITITTIKITIIMKLQQNRIHHYYLHYSLLIIILCIQYIPKQMQTHQNKKCFFTKNFLLCFSVKKKKDKKNVMCCGKQINQTTLLRSGKASLCLHLLPTLMWIELLTMSFSFLSLSLILLLFLLIFFYFLLLL